jgi:hypothetical protein
MAALIRLWHRAVHRIGRAAAPAAGPRRRAFAAHAHAAATR